MASLRATKATEKANSVPSLTSPLNLTPSLVPPLVACSEEGIAVKGRPRAEFRLAKALTSAMKTLSANKEARLSVDCIDGDRDLA